MKLYTSFHDFEQNHYRKGEALIFDQHLLFPDISHGLRYSVKIAIDSWSSTKVILTQKTVATFHTIENAKMFAEHLEKLQMDAMP